MTTEFSTELSGLLPSPEGPQRPSRGLDLKRLLRQQGPLMAVLFVALAIPLVAAAWILVPKKFEATALIRFPAKPQYVMYEDSGNNINRAEYERFVDTQATLIGDTPILERVLLKPEIRELPVVAESTDPIQTLKNMLDVRVDPGSELISVSCYSPKRQTALTIVNSVVREYEQFMTAKEKTRGGERRATLTLQKEELEKDLQSRLARIAVLRKSIGANVARSAEALATETQSYHDKISAAQADLTTAESELKRIEQLIETGNELLAEHREQPNEPVFEFGVESTVSRDPAVVTLKEQLASHDQELAVLRDRYVEGSPQVQVELKTRDAVARQLAETERAARADALKARLGEYRGQLEVAKSAKEDAESRYERFTQLLEEHMKKASQVSEVLAEIDEMEQNAEDARERWRSVEDQIHRIDIESNAPASVEMAGPAWAPEEPDAGKRLQAMALAVVFSAGVAAALGIWREFSDKRVRSAQDVAYLTDLPVLAAIPHASFDRLLKGVDPRRLVADCPQSTSANEYRRILTRIVYPPEGSAELKTCLVTSPSRGDGKTSVACNLAISLADAGRRVLLIDLSVRKPDVEPSFGLGHGPGLSEIVVRDDPPHDVIQPTAIEKLFVLGPGELGDGLVGQLASRRIMAFFEGAEEEFDHVIIDTAPALLMSDAKLLAPVVDGVILVVGEQSSSTGMVRRCLRELNEIGANVIGVALNGVRPTRGGYLRDNVASYYAHAGERTAASGEPPMLLQRYSPEPDTEEPYSEQEE